MSFKVEVIADGSGEFCGNALRFTTHEEAVLYARDLDSRWSLVKGRWRVVEAYDEPVNYRFENGHAISLSR